MIKIQNIYYMLCYAFKGLKKKGYKKMREESFDNVADLCAAILIKGLSVQIKQGLLKEYQEEQEALTIPRGKINISDSIKSRSLIKKKLVCVYDEFSVNTYMNRILKTTMLELLKSDVKRERKKRLRKLLTYFSGIDVLPVIEINWKLQYNRNNETYRMLIGICRLVIRGLIQSPDDGKQKFMDFDEEDKAWLFENFVLEYYKQEYPKLKVHAPWIRWQLDDDFSEGLPRMRTDITIEDGNKILIIDTKYYSRIMASYRESRKLRSGHLYQVFSYVKNKEAELKGTPHEVSGMLLYAKTEDEAEIQYDYQMSGNRVSVRTLNMNHNFIDIKKQLNGIVNDYFI